MTKHETDLSCKNCPDKKRCKDQQKKYLQNIDAILSYIRNSENEKYITELKNKITLPIRCDVVLEKQLKRKEAECEELKRYEYTYLDKFLDLKQTLEEIREIADLINKANCNYVKESEKILNKISEVLND